MHAEVDAPGQRTTGSPEDTRPLVAFVSIYGTQAKVLETRPFKITEAWDNRVKTMPVQFTIPLDVLAPGKYTCQVTLLDSLGQKAAFWQAPIVVVP